VFVVQTILLLAEEDEELRGSHRFDLPSTMRLLQKLYPSEINMWYNKLMKIAN
jgi:hypothetical protein